MDSKALRGFALFDGMSDDEVAESAKVFEPFRRVAGERVTRENEFGYSLFLILQGRVKVEIDGELVTELGVGDHFGEVSLVTGKRRNATVTALEMCEFAKIMIWDFAELLEKQPVLAARIKQVAEARA